MSKFNVVEPFKAVDMNGNEFWLDYDGAEGIGLWVGDPENSVPLSITTTGHLVRWILDNSEV